MPHNRKISEILDSMNSARRLVILACCLFLTSAAAAQAARETTQPSAPRAGDFETAKRLLSQGSLEAAAEEIQHELPLSADKVAGFNLLGIVYDQQGKHDDAIRSFEHALKISPGSVDTLNNLATSYASHGSIDLARQTFHRSLHLVPRNRTANYNLGILLLSQNQPKSAITYLARIPSSDISARLALVRAYLNAGMTSDGLAAAEKLSHEAAKDTSLHFSLGVQLASSAQYRAAAHEFELANALQPATFDILHDLGQAYLRGGQPEKAQEVLNESLRLQPQSADTLYLLAQAAADMQQDVDALELLVRARKIAPKNTDVLLLMARLSMKQSFFEDAIELLKQGLTIDAKRPDLHASLGESYFTVGKVDEAIAEFKTLMTIDPSPRSYALMGLCYRHLGRYDEAKRYLNQALSSDPNNLPALFNLAFVARRQGNEVQAEQYLQRALHLDPNYEDILFELASLKMEQKRYEEALALLRRSAQVSPKTAEVHYKLAVVERALHQADAAQRDMNIFKTLSKNSNPGPYPLQHVFDYLERRNELSSEQRTENDIHDLEVEVQRHPDRPRSLYLLAEALLTAGRTDEAMTVIKHLDEVSEGDFRTVLNIGVLLGRFHLYPEAIRYFEAAAKADPSSDQAKYDLANARFQNRDYAGSLQALQSMSADGQKDGSCAALLADIYSHTDHYEDAVQAWKQALAHAADNDQYYASLALMQLRTGNVDDAQRTLQDGLSRVPDSGYLYWAAGIVATVEGNAKSAEANLKKAVELMPSGERALASLGIFYYEAGRIPEAREVLQKCVEMFPQGSLDVGKIRATLDVAASDPKHSPQNSKELSPEARQEFYEMALAMADRER